MAEAVVTGKVHLSANFRTLPRGYARAGFARQTALTSEDGVGELVLYLSVSLRLRISFYLLSVSVCAASALCLLSRALFSVIVLTRLCLINC